MTATEKVLEMFGGASIHSNLVRRFPGIQPEAPQVARCDIRPECANCTMPSHGFLCHFSDGSCMRFPAAARKDGE